MKNNKGQAGVVLVVLGLVGLVVVLIFINQFFVMVPAGNVGVLKKFGAIQNLTLEPGFHGLTPIMDSVEFVPTVLRSKVDDAQASSKDLQIIKTAISIQYKANPSLAGKTLQNVGNLNVLEATVIHPAVQECLKANTAKYTAEELVTRREELKSNVTGDLLEYIDKTLKSMGIAGAITVDNVAITNFSFSDDFNQSIEAKVKAEQDALKAKNQKQQRITEAEAAAREVTLDAEAKAEAMTVQSKAEAAAIERKAKALAANQNLVQYTAVQNWNGVLPETMLGNSTPFVQIPLRAKAAPTTSEAQQ